MSADDAPAPNDATRPVGAGGAPADRTRPPSPPPLARVEDAGGLGLIWIVPVVALLLAGALAWSAWGERGLRVDVRFDQGHGLKAGDTVRHRGIVVGEVRGVELADAHDGVDVRLAFDPEAAHLARAGTRFWIVRPRLDFGGVAGLDTVIGSRYVALLPGSGAPQRDFVGLADPPIADALQPGLDITLEGERRASLSPGSPLSYRGLAIGAVLSVGLASDGRTVEVQARVLEPYAELVREDTRFWSTSGLTLDVGITGLSLHLDTLETLVRGGVELATPSADSRRVSTGHRFALASQPEKAWLQWAPPIPIGHSLLPPGSVTPQPLRAALTWSAGTFWSGEKKREGWVLALRDALLAPADLLAAPENADEGTPALEVAGTRVPLPETPDEIAPGLALLPVEGLVDTRPWPTSRQRAPAAPEDCLVITDVGAPPLTLAPGRFTVAADGWHVDAAVAIPARAHGAAVVARTDGALIGVLLLDDEDEARIVPLPRTLP